jgi:hypothetical protein
MTGISLFEILYSKGTLTLNIVGKNAWTYINKMISEVNGLNFNGSHQFV